MHEIITLSNGVRIAMEKMPSMRSASVGIFVGIGSRCEKAAESGSAHFIEHMLFKRTEEHSAAQLAYIMDGIGGHINAYTTREQTCFYAKVLDTHLVTAIDLLTEMFFRCAFDQEETESERGVILEEIGMYEDAPDDLCYEKLISGCFKGALGRPVLGKPSTLASMTGESLHKFKESHYTAGNIVISLCGSFDDRHIKLLKDRFSCLPKSKSKTLRKTHYTPHLTVKRKRTEQNQFCIAFPTNCLKSDDRYGASLLNTVLGGGVSSRLFQNIREKHGLCYSIYSFQSCFSDTGIISVVTAVNKDTELRTLSLIADELKKLCDSGISEEELVRAREQAKSSLVMGMESTSSRMLKLGNSLLAHDRCFTPDEIMDRFDSITREEILSLARERFDFEQMSLSALGKVQTVDQYTSAMGLY